MIRYIFNSLIFFLFKNKIAFLKLREYPIIEDYDYSEDISEFEERVGEGQGIFQWFTSIDFNRSWFYDNYDQPKYLFYKNKFYKYGKNEYRKLSLNQLKQL